MESGRRRLIGTRGENVVIEQVAGSCFLWRKSIYGPLRVVSRVGAAGGEKDDVGDGDETKKRWLNRCPGVSAFEYSRTRVV